MPETIKLESAGYLEGEFEDFYVDSDDNNFCLSIYTLDSVKKDNLETKETVEEILAEGTDPGEYELMAEVEGIFKDKENAYTIVIDVPVLTPDICRTQLGILSKQIGIELTVEDPGVPPANV